MRTRGAFSLFALVSLAACAFAGAAPLTQLKAMSFNLWPYGPDATVSNWANVIRTNNTDIAGLQECTFTNAQAIAAQLGYSFVQGGGAAECAIVSRYPIVRNLGQTTNAYGGIGAIIELSPGRRVAFFNAHLNYSPYGPYWLKAGSNTASIVAMENASRMPGLKELLNLAAPHINRSDPVFLVGDFNAPSHLDYTNFPWPTSLACVNAGLVDSYRELHPGDRKHPGAFGANEPGITWTPQGSSSEPDGVYDRIDFIHYSPGDGATPVGSTALDGSNGGADPWPSDHRAVLTTFKLTPPTPGTNVIQE